MLPGRVTSDSDLIAELLVRHLTIDPEAGLVGALETVLPTLRGGVLPRPRRQQQR